MATEVHISVEPVIENQIQEVTLDGHEIYVQQLSMSENLTKLAHKIDFSKDESEEKGKPTSEGDTDVTTDKAVTPFQPSLWPWDSVRTKLKAALTEVSVLSDVLNIAREKRYMVLDPVSQDPPESRMGMHMIAKKKALGSAASILLNGAERLRKSHYEKSINRAQPDFHIELLKLRQNWRLKKVGNVILGDLSYKSAGSRFWQGGTFQVRKKTDVNDEQVTESPSSSPSLNSSLEVIVPSELEGIAYIQVSVRTIPGPLTTSAGHVDLASAELMIPPNIGATVPTEVHWRSKLENAQNVIFCKEVFSQLAREAVSVKSPIPHMVVGNQIFSSVFPGVQLCIALCHYTDKDKRTQNSPHKPDHNHVLEHSLHQLLRELHYKNIHHPMPHPVTAMLGVSKRRKLAGPLAYSRKDLVEMTNNVTLLEQIVEQTRHIVLRKRAIEILDHMAQQIQDPQIASHWSSCNSATESALKVNITSMGFENIRTSLSLQILTDSLQVICRDGKVITLSHEMDELHDVVLCQVYQHHISSVHSLAKLMGWTVMSVSTHAGVGDMEMLGNTATLLLASPTGDRVIAIRSGAGSGLKASVQVCPRQPEDNVSSVVKDPKWENLGGAFKEVDITRLDGKTFVNKIELLMANLVCIER